MADRSVRRDPHDGIGAGRVELHRFEDVPVLVSVDLIESTEEIRLAMTPDNVASGQDLKKAFAVSSLDDFLFYGERIV